MDTWIPLAGGLVLLVCGGELLIRGAVQVASRLGVSPLVIGLTLVGFGTSTPELVTSVQASLAGSPGIAYGNIVGSNIANILLILGGSALLMPIVVSSGALKRDGTVMVLVTITFAGLALLMPTSRLIGGVFVLALVSYIYMAFRQERTAPESGHGAAYDKGLAAQEADSALMPERRPETPLWLSLATAVVGLALIVLGGHFLVDGAVNLARAVGVSETVIGLTMVAVGTSLPELVTSLMAALRKQADVAFGNIVGSNIYNILGIGGVTALIAPTEIPAEIVRFDNLVMIGASVAAMLLALSGRRIDRWEGGVLLGGYGAYVFVLLP